MEINHSSIVSFIWSIADDCLRDVYTRGKYRDIILPMIVIRRLDSVLEPSKQKVLEAKEKFGTLMEKTPWELYYNVAGNSFCNISRFTLKDMKQATNQQTLKENFIAYLDGFSPNVQDIINKFKFRNQIDTMIEAGILGSVIEKFTSPKINLSPYPILDDSGNELIEGLDNHVMGTIFEEIIRKFNEENNEEAGEHFTPRDIVKFMADLTILPIMNEIKDGRYTIYDGAAGTLGMATIAEERLIELSKDAGKDINVSIYGQEVNPETYAISKADMIIRGSGEDSKNIAYGSTLSNDGFRDMTFDFMLANPPYGKSWKNDKEQLGGNNIQDSRFIKWYKGEEFEMLPRVSDGQLLFLLNNVSKMNKDKMSRIAEVHNGSALFTGDAGSGESNARRYLLENDLVECIIALPENMFYNTGIGTFIWILNNQKEARRRGKVQLIDATSMKTPRRKNLGNKNCDLSEENQKEILDIYMNMRENENSIIFNNEDFGYWKVSIQRPLRKKVTVNDETLERIISVLNDVGVFEGDVTKAKALEIGLKGTAGALKELKDENNMGILLDILKSFKQEESYMDFKKFEKEFNKRAKEEGLKAGAFKTFEKVGLDDFFVEVDEDAEIITDSKGNPVPDTSLNDTENIPLNYEGGIEAYIEKEVLPFVPDAFMDENATKIGYEISFTKYFYKPQELEKVEDIVKELSEIDAEADKLFKDVMEGLL